MNRERVITKILCCCEKKKRFPSGISHVTLIQNAETRIHIQITTTAHCRPDKRKNTTHKKNNSIMGKSEVYLTSFDVSPVEYFDLMLDTVVQQEIHTSKDGLNMSVWRASDGPLLGVPNGTSRVVFSEPDLKVPKFLKKWVQKAQSYNEYSDFYPPKLGDDGDGDDGEDGGKGANRARTTSKRECVVVPHVGANRMTMTFTEYYTEHEESTARNPKCLVRSEVFVEVRAPLSRQQDGTVDTEHESRKSGRTRRVRETDVREE